MKSHRNPPTLADYIAQAVGGVAGTVAGAAIGTIAGFTGIVLGGIAGAIGGWWTGRAISEALEDRRRAAAESKKADAPN